MTAWLTERTSLRVMCTLCGQYYWQLGPRLVCMHCWRWYGWTAVVAVIVQTVIGVVIHTIAAILRLTLL